jgi:hypothetical protein
VFRVSGQRRFTVDGDEALEGHLEGVCQRACEAVQQRVPLRKLEGLLLGGGYGRGEGGVLCTPDGDLPYFGMKFVVLVRGWAWESRRRFLGGLQEAESALEAFAGVPVRFWLARTGDLLRPGGSLFCRELCLGHRRILGSPELMAGAAHSRFWPGTGPGQASRLLLCGGAGLLFALERLGRQPFLRADGDAVLRSLAEAQLAVGDAFLAAHGLYDVSVRERVSLLRRLGCPLELAGVQEMVRHHGEGAAFELHPHFCVEPVELLLSRLRAVLGVLGGVFLWNERRRLNREFPSAEDYARCRCNKWPRAAGWQSLGLQLCRGRLPGWRQWRELWRHPRQNLLEALALLLWGRNSLRDPALQQWMASKLRAPCRDFGSAVRAFRGLWDRYGCRGRYS